MGQTVLVTGGAGYIGSHTLIALVEAGHQPIVVDDFSNSHPKAIERVAALVGQTIPCYAIDVCDEVALNQVFETHSIDAVIHFAGFKAVGESVQKPIEYYQNNLQSTLVLAKVMLAHQVKRFVFSSSATVYGIPESVPMSEDFPLSCTNPYGWTKLMNEQILRDIAAANPGFSVILLRYFNPIGAHPSGQIGEDPNGVPNNLMPYIAKVAIGELKQLNIFGDDYDTKDGTGVRDYIHVVDLAEGHVAALNYLTNHPGVEAINLGTGVGYSVKEIKETFERVNGVSIPAVIAPRRPGDIATSYADPKKAKALLGWESRMTLEDMCRDVYRWQTNYPKGYRD